jgi:hypothetical protein
MRASIGCLQTEAAALLALLRSIRHPLSIAIDHVECDSTRAMCCNKRIERYSNVKLTLQVLHFF